MTSLPLMIVVALLTFFFADSILTPILLLLWTKGAALLLKIQALFTKKNLLQALAQSFLLTVKALFRLVNKVVTAWLLPLLMTRRQRYWLQNVIAGARRWMRFRLLRGWIRWRRQPLWIKVATILPAVLATLVVFVASGFLLAAMLGVSFVVPWIGGLPVTTVLFLRRQFAKAALFVFERMGLGPVVNKAVDWAIDVIWWRTPEPVQRRFDVWWQRMQMRLRRWVIGPRRKVMRRMAKLRRRRAGSATTPSDQPTIAAPADEKHITPRSATDPSPPTPPT